MNEEDDRLSNLPDDLIHKIFSSIDTKLFVQTSVLSSRWRFIWTSIPYLNISSEDFETLSRLSDFLTHALSRRNSEIEVSSVKIRFSPGFYVKHIKDTIWKLPALTTLNLQCAVFDYSAYNSPSLLISKCENLKNLTLESCEGLTGGFSIRHPRLSNLTLDNSLMGIKSVHMETPKLEYLTIRSWHRDKRELFIYISAPDHLTSLVYEGYYSSLSLPKNGFISLKEADIYVSEPIYEHSSRILSLLQHLHNVKFLTLNKEILELLSAYDMEQILPQPFTFTNLKRLKILLSRKQAPNESYFLIDSSPGATLEEIVVQCLVVELQVLLEEEKTNTKTDKTRTKRGKDPMESHNSKTFEQVKPQVMRLQIGKSIAVKNKSYRENQSFQNAIRRSIISKLQRIEVLLAKLPAARRALVQPCFASLCEEVVMGGITHCMKLSC